jgi:putative transposase
MDVEGRAIDNEFIERFWRTFKYDYLYSTPPVEGIDLYLSCAMVVVRINTQR